MNIEQLNNNYGIADKVKFVEGKGGFPVIEISNEHAKAAISVYAAHILSFQPVLAEDMMFVSSQAYYQEGKAIKGGTPICWPWFGPDPESKGRSSHGIARNRLWEMRDVVSTQDGATQVIMGLTDTEETRKIWDYSFNLAIAITVGSSLTVELITRNTGERAFSITQALHSYFKIGDIDRVAVLGLEDNAYIDKVDNNQQKTQAGAVTFDGECDRIYLDVQPELIIDDKALKRKLRLLLLIATRQLSGILGQIFRKKWPISAIEIT